MTAFMKLAMPDKPMPEVAAHSSRTFLLALAAGGNDKKISDEATAKAASFIAKDGKGTPVETLAYRALVARRLGKPEEITAITGEIVTL
jgi:hypothetical protein